MAAVPSPGVRSARPALGSRPALSWRTGLGSADDDRVFARAALDDAHVRLGPGCDLDPAPLPALTTRGRPCQTAIADREARQGRHVHRRTVDLLETFLGSIDVVQRQPPDDGVIRIGDPDRHPLAALVPADVEVARGGVGDDALPLRSLGPVRAVLRPSAKLEG